MKKIPDIKFFMEVSIAKRPFEHILWPKTHIKGVLP